MGAGASTQQRLGRPQLAAATPAPRLGRNTVAPSSQSAYPEVQLKILFIGLDGAGKTCVLHRIMRQDDIADVRSTNGFSKQTIELELKRPPLTRREARDMSRRAQHSISMQFGSLPAGVSIPTIHASPPGATPFASSNNSVPPTPPPADDNHHHTNSLLAPPVPHAQTSTSTSTFNFPDFNRSFRHSMALPTEGEMFHIHHAQRRYSDTIEHSEDNHFSRRRLRPGEEEPDFDDAYATDEQFAMFEEQVEQNRSVRLQSHENHAVQQAKQFAREYRQSKSVPSDLPASSAVVDSNGGGPPPFESTTTGGPQLNNVDLITNRRRNTQHTLPSTHTPTSALEENATLTTTEANKNHHHRRPTLLNTHSVPAPRPPHHQQPFNPLPYATQLTKRQRIEVFDLGGNANIRPIWEKYYAEVFGVVFVIDAADRSRVEEARLVLHAAFCDVRLAGKPFLLLFNKKDVIGCLRDSELVDLLQLRAMAEGDSLANSASHNSNYRIRIHVEGSTIFPSHIRNNTRRRELLRRTVLNGLRWLVGQILHPDYFNALLAQVQHASHVQHLHDQREQLEKLERYQKLREQDNDETLADDGNNEGDQPFRPIQELIHENGALKAAGPLHQRRTSASFQAMDLQHQRRRSSQRMAIPAALALGVATDGNERRLSGPIAETVVEQIITETHTIPDDIAPASNGVEQQANGDGGQSARRTSFAQKNGSVSKNGRRQPLYRRPNTKKDIERIRSIAMQHVSDDAVIE